MPRPNLQNRSHFKTYVRYFKNKFTSVIQDVSFGDIEEILSEKTAGISSTTPVKFIIFDNYDVVDITTLRDSGNYIYLPGLPNDVITLKVNGLEYDFSFVGDDGGLRYNGTTYNLNQSLSLPGIGMTVNGLGGALLSLSAGLPIPSYNIGISSTIINEGETISFTIETTNVGAGTTLYYDIPSLYVSADDFSDNSLTGSFNVIGTGATTGVATITKTILNDFDMVEGNETFNLNIRTESNIGSIVATSSTITINNKDIPSVTVGVSTTTVTEGDSVNFTINTENVGSGTTLYYNTTGTVSANDFSDNSLTGSFNIVSTGATTGIATITRILSNDLDIEGSETFNLQIRIGSASTTATIVATSSTITVIDAPIPTFEVGVSTTTIDEGESVNFTINTTGITTLVPLYYTTGGTVTASDFTDASLTGTFNIVSTGATTGIATIVRTLAYDFESGSADTFNLSIKTGSTSGTVVATSSTVTVNNLSQVCTITPSTTSVNEGNSISFTINTGGISTNNTLYYSINGTVSSADFSDGSLTGSFNIVGTGVTTGIATITKTVVNDLNIEGNETFNFNVRTGSISGPIVSTSSTITVNDVVPTYTITPSSTSINEGSNLTVTITTTGVPNGTTLYYTITGTAPTATSSDFYNSTLTGSLTITNNTGSFLREIIKDRLTEGNETFIIQLRLGSTSGTIVATSPSITINDNSQNVGQYANGLTFGPVQVNRDNGNSSLASDWYTICGIDNLPDGSKIALFIDTSGSMTQATIQASYDLLVSKLAEKNISIITVTNPNEDWITPFLTDLS